MASAIITQEYLRQILDYDPDTGNFTWLKALSYRGKVGTTAGHMTKSGRFILGIHGKLYYRYRLVWLYVTGEWPSKDLDHVDGNSSNDRFGNLRLCTMAENQQNLRRSRGKTHSGFLGVYPQAYGSWYARIKVKGGIIHLGTYTTPEEAHEKYLSAKRKLHEFNQI